MSELTESQQQEIRNLKSELACQMGYLERTFAPLEEIEQVSQKYQRRIEDITHKSPLMDFIRSYIKRLI